MRASKPFMGPPGYIVTTVATIAPLAAAFGAGDPKKEACGGTLADIVAEVSGLGGKSGLGAKVKQESVALAAATDKLTLLTTQVTALGSGITKQNQQDFWNAIEVVLTKNKQLADDQAKLDAGLKKISDTQVVIWPQRGDQLVRDATNPLKISDKVFTQWANVTKPADGEAIDQFNVYLKLESLDDGVVTPANPTAKTVKLANTVPVRFAGIGILHIFTQAPCGDPASKQIAKLDGTVLQFGRLYYLPVGGNAFKSVTVATALDDKGNPTSVQVANKSAMISSMAASGKAIATSLAGVPAAISAAETARTKAKTDQITAETALATAQAGAPNAGQIAILQAKTALAVATTTQLSADAALKAATETKVP